MASVSVPRQPRLGTPYDSSLPHHPPTLTMVLEAVRALNDPKGVSAFAIKRYILHQYPDVDPIRLKYYLKQALVKGVSQGYLVRPPKSSAARGASGSFKLGKEKAQQGESRKKKPSSDKSAKKPSSDKSAKKPSSDKAAKKPSSDKAAKKPSSDKAAAKLEREAAKQPKGNAPKQKSKRKGAEQVKKKASGTKPEAALGDGGTTVSEVEPKAKASGKKAAKATKEPSVPKASQAKLASGAKKGPKAEAELKGVPEAKVQSKPLRDEKAKGDSVPKGTVAKSRAATETKAAPAKGKPKAKKGAAKGQEKEESKAGSEA